MVALEHEQSRAVGMVIDIPDTGDGMTRALGSPVLLSGRSEPAVSSAPRVGQHSRNVLRDFGYGEGEIEALLDRAIVHQG